jgi:competence ComEA-like helix-hairpin-helix protein
MMHRFVRLLALVSVALQFAIVDLSARGPWVMLENCHYLTKRANDGDSFHVSVNGKEYIFRLYFVDAPETDTEFRDRVEEQAKYFGITVEQNTQVGLLAKAYTREKLSGPFSVRTCWEDAMGRSRMQRFYAMVQTNNGDLGEQLVENGLARIHGIQASPEGLTSARQEWQKLETFERKAKREKIGGWGPAEGRMMTRAKDLDSGKGADPFDAFFHPQKAAQTEPAQSTPIPGGNATSTSTSAVAPSGSPIASSNKLDINTASEAEIEDLPGIGSVMAQRIIAARPFKGADDLRNVKGIGDKKYEKLRPFFN